jgi:hypothetical protein
MISAGQSFSAATGENVMDNLENRNATLGMTPGATFSGNWSRDQDWWRDNFQNRPYVNVDRRFEDYEPAYRYGYESASRFRGRSWNEVEPELRTGWDRFEGRGHSTWENIKDAVRDAWEKITGH